MAALAVVIIPAVSAQDKVNFVLQDDSVQEVAIPTTTEVVIEVPPAQVIERTVDRTKTVVKKQYVTDHRALRLARQALATANAANAKVKALDVQVEKNRLDSIQRDHNLQANIDRAMVLAKSAKADTTTTTKDLAHLKVEHKSDLDKVALLFVGGMVMVALLAALLLILAAASVRR